MRRWLILITTHLVMLATGFAGGIYTLPILTAPRAPDTAALQNIATETLYAGRLVRNLKGSDLLHWGEGEVRSRAIASRTLGVSALARTTSLYAPPRGQHWVQVGSDYVLVAIATGLIVNLSLSSLHRARSVHTAALTSGSLAITLISNWNPYSQVTPMPVSVG